MKKHKRIIAGIMTICLAFGVGIIPENITPVTSLAAVAETDYKYENLTYKISENGTIEIISCDKSAVNVIIPDKIDGIKVTSIGYHAFSDCKNLEEIKLPESVENISSSSFYGCISLKEITIPDGVKNIEGSAFADCKSLKNITLPDSVENIQANAFNGCTALKSVNVSEKNKNYTSISGILFNKDKSEIIKYPPALSGKVYSVPDGVKIIGDYAFSGCMNLNEINLPDSVTDIGTEAFSECKKIPEIKIPYRVKRIGNSAFKNCTGLLTINIPKSLTKIGSYAFSGTAWIKARQKENPLVIVNDILIDGTAVSGNADIPDGTKTINSNAFADCKNLWGVRIPDSVTRIGDYAFKNCTALGEPLLPESVTTIGISAFQGCPNIRTLNIPESVTLIDYDAFRECKNLNMIAIFNTKCVINDEYGSTFSNKFDSETGKYSFRGMIYGYKDSTPLAYAKKYGINSEVIESIGEMPSGDVNGDYEFNETDIELLQQYISGVPDTKILYWQNADLNNDGVLDVFDLCLVKNLYLKKKKK